MPLLSPGAGACEWAHSLSRYRSPAAPGRMLCIQRAPPRQSQATAFIPWHLAAVLHCCLCAPSYDRACPGGVLVVCWCVGGVVVVWWCAGVLVVVRVVVWWALLASYPPLSPRVRQLAVAPPRTRLTATGAKERSVERSWCRVASTLAAPRSLPRAVGTAGIARGAPLLLSPSSEGAGVMHAPVLPRTPRTPRRRMVPGRGFISGPVVRGVF